MGTQKFSESITAQSAPIAYAEEISPHDANELSSYSRAIFVGGDGDLKLTTIGGSTVTLVAVKAGSILPIQAKIVFDTGTTATDLIALW